MKAILAQWNNSHCRHLRSSLNPWGSVATVVTWLGTCGGYIHEIFANRRNRRVKSVDQRLLSFSMRNAQ